MVTVVVLIMDVTLELKFVVESNLIRVSYHCISRYFYFNSYFKQLYTSNKMEWFNYKSMCGTHGYSTLLVCFKEELA